MAEHADLLVTIGDPPTSRKLERPRRVLVRWHTYGGRRVELTMDQVAAAPGRVCVAQVRPEPFPWNAWIPVAAVRPAQMSGDDADRSSSGDGAA